MFYGWWVVAACFVIAAFAWGLGLFGSSVYLQAVTSTWAACATTTSTRGKASPWSCSTAGGAPSTAA